MLMTQFVILKGNRNGNLIERTKKYYRQLCSQDTSKETIWKKNLPKEYSRQDLYSPKKTAKEDLLKKTQKCSPTQLYSQREHRARTVERRQNAIDTIWHSQEQQTRTYERTQKYSRHNLYSQETETHETNIRVSKAKTNLLKRTQNTLKMCLKTTNL
ncbi:hypothetical protein AVEN_128803-1 [Araneus ventricosus]|uniref:Uncharacterized protein n=1 Tax=Araneus ventricosus TaxID=182803 RepID=A0A4Y2VWZ8_ARAVE|nr:hypothetical protein AVEN_128803-1 [Araneus ventricosus]